jgi:hypothetical protein
MADHTFIDDDVDGVSWQVYDVIEIGLKDGADALILNKKDVVALAKEFHLVVYEKGSEL